MAIPNSRHDAPPPPLPPPRYIDDLTAGSDPGWAWGNSHNGGFRKLRGAESSIPENWDRRMEDRRPPEKPVRQELGRRQDSTSTIRSPNEVDRNHDLARHLDEGYYSLSGPRSSAMSQQLHGERQLQQRNLENSSQAYDNKLLSKIGKPRTPPRSTTLGSNETSPTSTRPFHASGKHQNQLRSLSFQNSESSLYSSSAYSDSPPIKREPSGYGDSPWSKPMSPGFIPSATSAKSFQDWRSPTLGHGTPPSATDPDQYPYIPQRFPSSTNALRQQKSRRSNSGPLLSSFDESGSGLKNTASERIIPVKRENYEASIFSETDSADPTFPMEETVRQLHLEDHAPLSNYSDSIPHYHSRPRPTLHTSRSRPGMKRKLSRSPPPSQAVELANEANAQMLAAAGMNADPLTFQRNTAQRVSPVSRYGQNQGSFSSQSSAGPRNNSYASSAGLSVGGSSITSFDQHSPGRISPSFDHQQPQQRHYQLKSEADSPYISTLPVNTDSSNTRPQQQYAPSPLDNSNEMADPKFPNLQAQRRSNAPNMQSSAFICGCCPKKPKKFDTIEELRLHESEKQYSCNYCNNRFKNKNEAERHQNSLHLRKHSWSCATLGGQYDNAFYPSTSVPPPENNPNQPAPPPPNPSIADSDICGYCGERFPNHPAPDWDLRVAHLTNVHKFDECNRSKKFFRADHFRQHLKHSHAGTSGKWTNMLESACMKEEPQDPASVSMPVQGAPVANMGMGQAMSPANVAQANMGPNMSQTNIGQHISGQGNISQADMGPNVGQPDMGEADMAQQQMASIDMSNIDPNIGIQHMASMAALTDSAGRGIAVQGQQVRNDRLREATQEL